MRQTTVSVTLTLRGRRNKYTSGTNVEPEAPLPGPADTNTPPMLPKAGRQPWRRDSGNSFACPAAMDTCLSMPAHTVVSTTAPRTSMHALSPEATQDPHRSILRLGGRQGDICRLKHGPLKSSDGPARFPIHPSALATFCRRAICALGEPDAGCHPTARSDIARCSDGRPDADSTMRRCKMHHNRGGKGSWAVGQEYRIPPVYLYICLGTLGEETMLRAQLQSGRADRLVVLYKVLPRMTTEGFRRPTPRPTPGLLEP